MRTIIALAGILLLFSSPFAYATSANQSNRVALVIGNSAYQFANQLANPSNDAEDISAALKKAGFEVIQGINLDRTSTIRIVQKFARRLKSASVGVFFYAGHGIQVSGQNYLVPIDARLQDASGIDFELVRVSLIQRTMERVSKSNVIFLDACRNNPLARNLARAMGTRSASIGRGLAPIESGVGTLISFSTQPGNVALDGTGRNSPYAAALSKRLTIPGDDISNVLIKVRKDVMKVTNNRQIPWEHTALTDRLFFMAENSGRSPGEDTATSSTSMANLDSTPRSADLNSSAHLQTKKLQQELKRVGCFKDPIDGKWGIELRQALASYNAFKNAALPLDASSVALTINAIQSAKKQACPATAYRGGLCKQGNLDHCKLSCNLGFKKNCRRLAKFKNSGAGARGGNCKTGNLDHCENSCRKGNSTACTRVKFLKKLLAQQK